MKRLQTHYIDLYMIHWPLNPDTYAMFADLSKQGVTGPAGQAVTVPRLEEVVDALVRLQEEGKIRWLGLLFFWNARRIPTEDSISPLSILILTRQAPTVAEVS